MNYTNLFWLATIIFFSTTLVLLIQNRNSLNYLFYIQALAGTSMFVTSKIGRTFLGLE